MVAEDGKCPKPQKLTPPNELMEKYGDALRLYSINSVWLKVRTFSDLGVRDSETHYYRGITRILLIHAVIDKWTLEN